MRRFVKVVPCTIALLVLTMVFSPTLASSTGPTVKVVGGNGVRINSIIFSTYHFSPGKTHARPGQMVTFLNTGTCTDCQHTISLVNDSQLPAAFDDVFACGAPGTVCFNIVSAHFPQGPGGPTTNPIANVTGEPTGFHGGNSFLITQGQSIEIGISAPTGTTLHYMCAFHAWMQGTIVVGQDTTNAEQ